MSIVDRIIEADKNNQALFQYIGNDSRKINRTFTQEEKSSTHEIAENLQKFIEENPSEFSADGTLFSGRRKANIREKGEIFSFGKFISATFDIEIAESFVHPNPEEKILFVFSVPKGFNQGIAVHCQLQIDWNGVDEQEYILHPKTQWEVVDVQETAVYLKAV